MALYRAKERGRNRLQLFGPALQVRVQEQMTLEKRLRHALEQNQFELVYQPQVSLGSGRVTGVEALLRWRHPELGLVPPDEFLPLAEDNGLIEPLGLWVLRTACLQHRAWRTSGLPDLRLAVNMSARQFHFAGLERRVRAVLRITAMEPGWLELELPESLLMHAGDATAAVIDQLAALGIGFALSDFGSGGSSVNCLKRFPIRRLKLGRSFVQDVVISEGDAGLVRAVIAMTRYLGVEVLAEGIESQEQLERLRRFGCDEGQGHFLGRPAIAAEVPALVRRQGGPQIQVVASA